MKKGLIFLFILLFIPLVNAQEITLFGQSFSIILALPIIFMAIISFIFLFIILKDNISKIHLPKFNLKSHKKQETKDQEKIDFNAKFSELRQKLNKNDLKEYLDNLNVTFKDYLKFRHNYKQEITLEEVSQIKGINRNEIELADKIVKLKYSGVDLKRDRINDVNSLFEKLINYKPEIVTKEVEHFSIFKGFRSLFAKKQKQVKIQPRLELPQAPSKIILKPVFSEAPKPVRISIFTRHKKNKILKLLTKGTKLIYSNPIKAKRIFGLALLKYNKLKLIKDWELTLKFRLFTKEMLKVFPHEKHFFDVSNKIVALKNSGKSLTLDSLDTISSLKDLIKHEEKVVNVKLTYFSKKLEFEEEKLKHFVRNKELMTSRLIKDFGKAIDLSNPEEKETKNFRALNKERERAMKTLEKIPEPPRYERESLFNILHNRFTNHEIIQRKKYILKLLEKAFNNLNKYPTEAKEYYGQALLAYYKLPVKQDTLIYNKIMDFHKVFTEEHGVLDKKLFDTSSSLMKLKHSKKHLSQEAVSLFDKFNLHFKKSKQLELPIAPKPIKESYKYNIINPENAKQEKFYDYEMPEVKVIMAAENKFGLKNLPDLNIREFPAQYKYKKQYITAGLPRYTKIKQARDIMPMPKVEIVKNYKLSKHVRELKRQEQEIYDKLNKLN
ncbi:MAG: hypothetical protein AABW56_03440 [Nanoarchaeota archaeon]